jgi:hypothetical protein
MNHMFYMIMFHSEAEKRRKAALLAGFASTSAPVITNLISMYIGVASTV